MWRDIAIWHCEHHSPLLIHSSLIQSSRSWTAINVTHEQCLLPGFPTQPSCLKHKSSFKRKSVQQGYQYRSIRERAPFVIPSSKYITATAFLQYDCKHLETQDFIVLPTCYFYLILSLSLSSLTLQKPGLLHSLAVVGSWLSFFSRLAFSWLHWTGALWCAEIRATQASYIVLLW